MSFDLGDYKEVKDRIADFRTKFPEGTLQSEVVPSTFNEFVIVKGYAYRTPTDERPGVGLAWEPVPGKTPYTKDSELMNAETSAWGRAIIAVGASDASHAVATREDVERRQETQDETTADRIFRLIGEAGVDNPKQYAHEAMEALGLNHPLKDDSVDKMVARAVELWRAVEDQIEMPYE